MALPRTWLPRAEEIIAVLRRMKSAQLDRAAIEELFQLQRRAAIDLMTQAGATGKRGAPFLIDRTSLLVWVERVFQDESWQLQRRKETRVELSQSLTEVQALRAAMAEQGKEPVRFPIAEAHFRANLTSLPSSIQVAPGLITIEVSAAAPELMLTLACQLLYELAMALNNDPAGFRARLSAGVDEPEVAPLPDPTLPL